MRKDRPSKLKGLAWALAACLCGAFFAVGVSPLAHLIPWSWEKALGGAIPLDLSVKECRPDPGADLLLRRLVGRLYPIEPGDASFPMQVKFVRDPVVNAFATLGGQIRVNSGLVESAESPEELAGVLAHEMEHVRHRHIMERALVNLFTAEGVHLILGGGTTPGRLAKFFLNIDFTRAQEAQADEDGLRRLRWAGVDNAGFKAFFRRMEKQGAGSTFLSDHPSDRDRMEMVEKFGNGDVKPIMSPEEWGFLKAHCCGR